MVVNHINHSLTIRFHRKSNKSIFQRNQRMVLIDASQFSFNAPFEGQNHRMGGFVEATETTGCEKSLTP